MTDPTMPALTPEELEAFKKHNSVDLFFARCEVEGFISEDYTGPEIRAAYPELGPVVVYAVTSEWTTLDPESPDLDFLDYYEWITTLPHPRVIVSMDADARTGRTSSFGAQQARTLKRLGVAGVVTSIGLHKVSAVRAAGMPVWTTGVAPAHASYHLIRYGAPVAVGRVQWQTGDLVFADENGAIRIPRGIARAVLHRMEDKGEPSHGPTYYDVIDAPDFTIAKLRAWMATHPTIYPPVDPSAKDRWWAANGHRLAPRGS